MDFLTDSNNTFAPGSQSLGLRYRLSEGETARVAIGTFANHALGFWYRPSYARSVDSYHQERFADASTLGLHLDGRVGNDRMFIQAQAGLLTVL